MSNRNALSFDLRLASNLAQRLSGGASAPAPLEREPGADYASFDASLFGGSLAPASSPVQVDPSVVPAPVEVRIERPEESFDSWESLLGWCEKVFEADLCFVVDSQGFLLHYETHGAWPYTDIEDVASGLAITITRADDAQPTGRARALSIGYASCWASCLRLEHDDTEDLMLVLLTDEPVSHADLAVLREVVTHSQASL